MKRTAAHYTQQLLATCTEFGWQLATNLAAEQAASDAEQAASDAEQALYDRGKHIMNLTQHTFSAEQVADLWPVADVAKDYNPTHAMLSCPPTRSPSAGQLRPATPTVL